MHSKFEIQMTEKAKYRYSMKVLQLEQKTFSNCFEESLFLQYELHSLGFSLRTLIPADSSLSIIS